MNSHYFCQTCGTGIVNPDEDDFINGLCECHNQEEFSDIEESVGDIAEDSNGLAILTPHGWWRLTDEEVLSLNSGLGQMIQHRLTRPSSDDDQSTILTRGRRAHTVGDNWL